MIQALYDTVAAWVPPGSHVLDLGTGDGAFLQRLVEHRKVAAEGVEIDGTLAARCIERGLVVHQGDILDGLDQYGRNSFDYVLLLGTFQELIEPWRVLEEAFRVGNRVIVGFNNFAYWRARIQMLFRGRSPVTPRMPYPWYLSPNLQYFSILDFKDFCRTKELDLEDIAYFSGRRKIRWFSNLM
ncbi:MAG: methyltransferase domain-containing protein, partial [Leptospiraceae bacterium]|nr:methyltransferase domain-containing protein [Leptospiraceae bacterium]